MIDDKTSRRAASVLSKNVSSSLPRLDLQSQKNPITGKYMNLSHMLSAMFEGKLSSFYKAAVHIMRRVAKKKTRGGRIFQKVKQAQSIQTGNSALDLSA